MATQLLVNVLTVTNLAGGSSVTLAHGLQVAGVGVVPTQVLCARASPLVVSAATDTSITVANPTASPLTAIFRCEFDHSIHATGATPVRWTGLPVIPATPVAIYGQFFSNDDQPIADGGVGINVVYFESVASANGVTCVDPGTGFNTQLTVASAGVYAFTLSPQMFKTAGGGVAQAQIWVRKNGVDVPETASFVTVSNNQHTLSFIEIILPMNVGEYVEWVAHATLANVQLEQEPASVAPAVTRPASPSVIAGVKLIGV